MKAITNKYYLNRTLSAAIPVLPDAQVNLHWNHLERSSADLGHSS